MGFWEIAGGCNRITLTPNGLSEGGHPALEILILKAVKPGMID
jgi:hypothetical protein